MPARMCACVPETGRPNWCQTQAVMNPNPHFLDQMFLPNTLTDHTFVCDTYVYMYVYMQVCLCLQSTPSTPMVAASQHFWTGCAEVFSESPHQTPRGRETRLADPRCSTQDACKKQTVTGGHKHSYILHTDSLLSRPIGILLSQHYFAISKIQSTVLKQIYKCLQCNIKLINLYDSKN